MNGSPAGYRSLTPSERRVLSLAAIGCKRPCDMANRMSTSVNQVNDYIHRALMKLGARSLDQAVVLYSGRAADQFQESSVGLSR